MADNSLNTVGKTVRTGRAEVLLRDFAFEALTVYQPVRLFGKTLLTVCREVSLKTLRENVNSTKQTVEFIDDFENADSHLFRVVLRQKEKRYDGLLEVRYTDAEYHFDRIEKDRMW